MDPTQFHNPFSAEFVTDLEAKMLINVSHLKALSMQKKETNHNGTERLLPTVHYDISNFATYSRISRQLKKHTRVTSTRLFLAPAFD